VITRKESILGEEDVHDFFHEGWPYEDKEGIYIKVGQGEARAMSSIDEDRVEPFGFIREGYDYD